MQEPVGTVERTLSPGAARKTCGPVQESPVRLSDVSVNETAMASG